MASTLPFNSTCCDTCDDQLVVNIPGADGENGTAGADGEDGENAYTTLSAAFTQPAVGADVTASVGSSTWMVTGQVIYVGTGGYYTVISKPSTAQVVLRNRGDTGNAAAASVIPSSSGVGPAGVAGAPGLVSGAAGGDLKGTYPNPQIALGNAKGSLIVGGGVNSAALSAGANGTRLRANSAATLGVDWQPVDLSSGTYTEVSGQLPIGNGGTGQATANNAFNALAPTTTRGDLIVRTTGVNARLPVGSNGTLLLSNGVDPFYGRLSASYVSEDMGRAPIDVFTVKHILGANAPGGSSLSGAWRTRPLNTECVNTIGAMAVLNANQITLPAGSYRVRANSCMRASDDHRCGLYNVTDAVWLNDTESGTRIIGMPVTAESATARQAVAHVEGRFTIESSKVIELRYRCTTDRATDGLGAATNWGVSEVYAIVTFEREALTSPVEEEPPGEPEGLVSESGESLTTEEGDALIPD